MALDWDKINQNLNEQLTNPEFNLLQKSFTAANGSKTDYRDFTELAKLTTIAENNAALDAVKAFGIGQKVELMYD